MDWTLAAHPTLAGKPGPLVLAILDGVGIGSEDESDAVFQAHTPFLDSINGPEIATQLKAHGKAVGLPSEGDMGNSEVGHNALGCGVVHDQGASLVGKAIASGSMFGGAVWKAAIEQCLREQSTLHCIALLSDGNVHSHIDHLESILGQAAKEGCRRLRVHALLDGRDVPPTSADLYIDRLEKFLSTLRESGVDVQVASGGGRMTTTMDRYEADYGMVERGYRAHVQAEAERSFESLSQALEVLRFETPGIGDQNLATFVIENPKTGKSPMEDGDVVFLANFRGDRAIEICQALESEEFSAFERGVRPKLFFAGLMEYDGDLKIPKNYLVAPPTIDNTMGEYLVQNRVSQFAISETQKFGHVTYFWNGNRSGYFDDKYEEYVEVPSDTRPFEERPWMKAAEITDRLIEALFSGQHQFLRVNYANGDMVGHTGKLEATICAVSSVDLQLARLAKAVRQVGGTLVVTADHGNADEMFQHDKGGKIVRDKGGTAIAKTSHTLSAVPLRIYDPKREGRYSLSQSAGGIANVTATCLELLGFSAPSEFSPSLLETTR